MTLRVAISLASLSPGAVGGSERYVRELLTALADEQDVQAIALVPPAARHEYKGRPLRFGVPKDGIARAAGLSAGLLAGRVLGRAAADVDVIHHPLTVPLVRPRVPGVITLHDLAHHELPDLFPAAERAFRKVAYDAAARRAAAVITPSEHARRTIVERLGVSPERVVAIPHGVNRAVFAPEGDDLELTVPERYVLYPANLWPHKNHARLIEAWARLDDRDLALVLTGRADERLPPLLEQARRLGVGDRVRHLGHVPAETLPALYRRAQAVVFPSLFEGFGAPVLEAMACGTPVATSDRGALPEVAGGAAELFDPEDVDAIAAATERTAGNPARREAGLRRAAELTWAAAARRHVEVYRSVAKRP